MAAPAYVAVYLLSILQYCQLLGGPLQPPLQGDPMCKYPGLRAILVHQRAPPQAFYVIPVLEVPARQRVDGAIAMFGTVSESILAEPLSQGNRTRLIPPGLQTHLHILVSEAKAQVGDLLSIPLAACRLYSIPRQEIYTNHICGGRSCRGLLLRYGLLPVDRGRPFGHAGRSGGGWPFQYPACDLCRRALQYTLGDGLGG